MRDLRVALNSLYDPAVLRASPLIELFGLAAERNPISALRRTLLNGIESLRPNRDTPESARTWRVYQILRRRYTEQVTQREVAADLGLSIRQLQREERLAREVLADCLWNAHNLAAAPQGRPEVSIRDEGTERPVETQVPSRLEELESLKRVVHIEMVGNEYQTIHVITVWMRQDDGVDFQNFSPSQVRRKDPGTRVKSSYIGESAAIQHKIAPTREFY